MIPILMRHETDNIIGKVEKTEDGYKFTFSKEVKITREMLFEIFGGAGIKITEMEEDNGILYIKEGYILEFSLGI